MTTKKTSPTSKEMRWIEKVAKDAEILVREGQVVKEGEVIARTGRSESRQYDASLILSRYSKESLRQLETGIKGRVITEGELLFSEGGLFAKKIYCPFSGKITGIDEFGNIDYEIESVETKEIKAPVKGKVVKVRKDEVIIQFKGYRFDGKGVVGGKVWGGLGRKVGKLTDLSYRLSGEVVLCEKVDQVMTIKAQVVGVAGMVAKIRGETGTEEKIETDLPILEIDEKGWEELNKLRLKKGSQYRVLLNSGKGRLLIAA
jgi:hypothetical protein